LDTASTEQTLVARLRKRAEIRRAIPTRKSVQEGSTDRIADLLEEAADALNAAEETLTTIRDSTEIAASIQNVTPQCRANRTSFGAFEEAISRIRQAYVAYHDAQANEDVTWRISLVRVEQDETKSVKP
jgi:hypothetical protein